MHADNRYILYHIWREAKVISHSFRILNVCTIYIYSTTLIYFVSQIQQPFNLEYKHGYKMFYSNREY